MIEELLQDIQHPPCDLNADERTILDPVISQLMTRLDQMSLDELFSRIERLSKEHRLQILKRLTELQS